MFYKDCLDQIMQPAIRYLVCLLMNDILFTWILIALPLVVLYVKETVARNKN